MKSASMMSIGQNTSRQDNMIAQQHREFQMKVMGVTDPSKRKTDMNVIST